MTVATPDVGLHRMADQATRLRTAAMLAALFALAVAVVAALGQPGGAFTQRELRDMSGLPFAPPQIQRRIAPAVNGSSDFDRQITQLEDILRGSPPPQPAASPAR